MAVYIRTEAQSRAARSVNRPARGERHHLDRIAETNSGGHPPERRSADQRTESDPRPRRSARHHLEYLADTNPGGLATGPDRRTATRDRRRTAQ